MMQDYIKLINSISTLIRCGAACNFLLKRDLEFAVALLTAAESKITERNKAG